MDFAALPPEVNSGRMYAGAGSGPLVAAAAAWDGLVSELSAAATSYQSVISGLTGGSWLGSASTSMAAAAAPYVAWMRTTTTAAQHTASQARSAASAYETAFAAMVPPPVIAANRTLLASLVATNIVGQNTAAIAATEAQYGEMWAQDAAAMYGYAGTSAAATQLTPFSSAPQTTNPAGSAAQPGAVSAATGTGGLAQLVSQVPTALQGLASSGAAVDPITALENFLSTPVVSGLNTLFGTVGNDVGFPLSGLLFVACLPGFFLGPLLALALPNLGVAAAAAPAAAAVSDVSGSGLGSTLTGSLGSGAGGEVSAGLGRAASVGGLSVPQSWGSAAPEIRLAAKALPMAGPADGLPQAAAAGPGGFFGGMPPVGSVVNAPRTGEPGSRNRARAKVMAQMPGESGSGRPLGRSLPPGRRAPDVSSSLSDGERDELDELRKELAELEMERDAAARLIKEAIRP